MSDLIKRVSPNYIQELAKKDYTDEYKYLSPVNLKLPCMTKIELPELQWLNMDSEPQKTKIANTGQTVIVSGTWQKNRPRITGGPLLTTYAFSQLHYHWGSDNTYGSEHSYNDKKVPLEMHAVFLKENCKKQEDALAEKDGAVVVSYAYKLDDEPNPGIKLVCDELPYIPNPSQLIELEDPVNLTTFVSPFHNDYFVYWGSVRTNACKHVLLWIICRQPYAVNEKQLETFRQLFTSGHQPIMHNSRHTHHQGYEVFHVNPSAYKEDVLYKKTENNKCKIVMTQRRLKELKNRRKQSNRQMRGKKYNSSASSVESSSESVHPSISSKSRISRNYSSSSEGYLEDEKPNLDGQNGELSNNCGILKTGITRNSSANSSIKGSEQKKSKPLKIQSYYSKFFSLQNKGKKDKSNKSSSTKTDNKTDTDDSNNNDAEEKWKIEQVKRSFNQIKSNDLTVMNIKIDNDIEFDLESNTENQQKKKESKILKHLQSELEGAKSKLTNEYYLTKPSNEQENLTGEEGFERLAELSINIMDKNDKSSKDLNENWENYKNIKTDTSKEVTFSKNKKDENEVHCYRVTSELKSSIQLQSEKDEDNILKSNQLNDCIVQNKICNDYTDQILNETNFNIHDDTSMNKTQQDIGINTMSLNELIYSMNLNKIYQCKHIEKSEDIKSTVTEFSESSNIVTFSSKNKLIDENSNIVSVPCSSKNDYNVNDKEEQPRSKQKSHYTSSSMSRHSSRSSRKSNNTDNSETAGSQSKYAYSGKSICSSTEVTEDEQSDASTNTQIGHKCRKHTKSINSENKNHQHNNTTNETNTKKIYFTGHNYTNKIKNNNQNLLKSRKDETSSVSTNRSIKTAPIIKSTESQISKNSKKSVTNILLVDSKKSKSSNFYTGESNEKEVDNKINQSHDYISDVSLNGTKTKFTQDDIEHLDNIAISTTSQSGIRSNSSSSSKKSSNECKKHKIRLNTPPTSDINYTEHMKKQEILKKSNKSIIQGTNVRSNTISSFYAFSNDSKTHSKSPHKLKKQNKFVTCKDSLHLLKDSANTKIPSLKFVLSKKDIHLRNEKNKVRPQTVVATPISRQISNLNKLRPKTTASCVSSEINSTKTTQSRTHLNANTQFKTDKLTTNVLCKATKVVNCTKLPIKGKLQPLPARAWRY